MINKIRTALRLVLLFCICSICTYGQEEESIRKFAQFAKKVVEHNQANLSLLEQASRDNRYVTESQLLELRNQRMELAKETTALLTAPRENRLLLTQMPQTLKIISNMRFRVMTISAQFRKLWREMQARKIITESEADIPQKWSFFALILQDQEIRHADTEKRLRDIIVRIKACREEAKKYYTLMFTNSYSEISEEEVATRLAKLTETMDMEYRIACEYIADDPVGAEELKKELDKIISLEKHGGIRVSY